MATIPLQTLNFNTRQTLHNTFIKLHEFYKYMVLKGVDKNEALTREQLIRPFIKALGYIVDSEQKNGTILLDLWPEVTGHEDNDNRCDFLIKLNPQIDNVHAIIEAKPVNRDLDKASKDHRGTPTNQLRKYFDSKDWKANVILGILTNGFEYRFFKNKDTVNPNDSGMENEPFFRTNLKELSENKDNCIDILNYYVCKKVIEACSRISTKEDNNILIDSAQKSYGEHIKRVIRIMKVRSVVLEIIKEGFSVSYLRKLINDVNNIDEQVKIQKRNEFAILIWNKIPELKLSYYTLAGNAAKQKKDTAEKEYNDWIAIVKSTLDEFEDNNDEVGDSDDIPDSGNESSNDSRDGDSSNTDPKPMDGSNKDPKPVDGSNIDSKPESTQIITTEHELAVRDCIQKIVGKLCSINYIDNLDYIDFVISNLSEEELKRKEGGKRSKDSKNCVFCIRYGKQDKKINEHPQDGNYINAALTFYCSFLKDPKDGSPAAILNTKIKDAGKTWKRGDNGWISVQIQSMDDINAISNAIQYWFKIRNDEFYKKQDNNNNISTSLATN